MASQLDDKTKLTVIRFSVKTIHTEDQSDLLGVFRQRNDLIDVIVQLTLHHFIRILYISYQFL